jgi:hypothetical protein
MKRPVRDPAVLRDVSQHLYYEYSTFRTLSQALRNPLFHKGAVKNALLESFAIHARVLLFFLFADNPQKDDVIAEDFLTNPEQWPQIRGEMPDALKLVKQRVGKEIAHLTYARLDVTPDTKGWKFLAIADAVKQLVDTFITRVPPEHLAPAWERKINRLHTRQAAN